MKLIIIEVSDRKAFEATMIANHIGMTRISSNDKKTIYLVALEAENIDIVKKYGNGFILKLNLYEKF